MFVLDVRKTMSRRTSRSPRPFRFPATPSSRENPFQIIENQFRRKTGQQQTIHIRCALVQFRFGPTRSKPRQFNERFGSIRDCTKLNIKFRSESRNGFLHCRGLPPPIRVRFGDHDNRFVTIRFAERCLLPRGNSIRELVPARASD